MLLLHNMMLIIQFVRSEAKTQRNVKMRQIGKW